MLTLTVTLTLPGMSIDIHTRTKCYRISHFYLKHCLTCHRRVCIFSLSLLYFLIRPRLLMPFRGHVQTQVSAKLENDLMEHTTGMWGRGAPRGEREGRTGDAAFSRAKCYYCIAYLSRRFTHVHFKYRVIMIIIMMVIF